MDEGFGSAAPDVHEELRRAQERTTRLAVRIDEVRCQARRYRGQRDALGLAAALALVLLCALLAS